jgi:hypothetical protein
VATSTVATITSTIARKNESGFPTVTTMSHHTDLWVARHATAATAATAEHIIRAGGSKDESLPRQCATRSAIGLAAAQTLRL